MFLKNCKIHMKTLRPATLFKKTLWHRCVPVNFAKCLRTHYFKEHLQLLLLIKLICKLFCQKSKWKTRIIVNHSDHYYISYTSVFEKSREYWKKHKFFTRKVSGIKKQWIEEASVEKCFEIKPTLKSPKFRKKMLLQNLGLVISQTVYQ